MKKMTHLILWITIFAFSTVSAGEIVHPELAQKLNQSKEDELVRILITMQEQADYNQLMIATAGLTKGETRKVVIGELKDLADRTQNRVLAHLQAQIQSGKVKDLHSVWIANILYCQAVPEVIISLQDFPEIAEVSWDPEQYMLFHERPNKSETPPYQGTDEIAWGVSDINADDVWAMGYYGTGAIVGMIDTGVNYNHVDLADHMWNGGSQYPHHGWDFYNNDNDPMDDGSSWMGGHGTHTAGSVGSDGTAGSQCGVAPNATIMAIKVLSGNGYGSEGPVISGINFAVEQGADIFSMSLGWQSTSQRPQFRTACNNALAAGVIGVIAAGNEGNQLSWYPIPGNVRTPGDVPPPWLHPNQTLTGGLSCVVTAGATNINHTIAGFSSVGPSTWEGVSPWYDYPYSGGSQMGLIDPDVCAPGEDIKSCWFLDNWGYSDGWDGTSMATPHITGTLALMLDKDPTLSPAQLNMYLETTALDWGAIGKDNTYGAGRIDALAAVSAVPGGTLPNVNISITPTGSTALPSTGGTLYFDVSLHNNETYPVYLTAWLDWTYPNGTTSSAQILRNLTMSAGGSIYRSLYATVAGSEPNGNYTCWAHMGSSYGGTIYSEDSFPFSKGLDGAIPGEWVSQTQVFGWDDPIVADIQPEAFSLGQAYPNPFNPTATIPFTLPERSSISLKIFDLSGREVATVLQGELPAGQYHYDFNAASLSSGIYLYRLEAPGFSKTMKFMLLK